jgi:hypothetical protein
VCCVYHHGAKLLIKKENKQVSAYRCEDWTVSKNYMLLGKIPHEARSKVVLKHPLYSPYLSPCDYFTCLGKEPASWMSVRVLSKYNYAIWAQMIDSLHHWQKKYFFVGYLTTLSVSILYSVGKSELITAVITLS